MAVEVFRVFSMETQITAIFLFCLHITGN